MVVLSFGREEEAGGEDSLGVVCHGTVGKVESLKVDDGGGGDRVRVVKERGGPEDQLFRVVREDLEFFFRRQGGYRRCRCTGTIGRRGSIGRM